MRLIKFKFLFLVMAVAIGNVMLYGQESEKSAEYYFELGLKYHNECLTTNPQVADFAIEAFEKSLELKEDSITKAYLGSAWTLKGNVAINPLSKIDYVLEGCKMIDEAVESDSENVVTRRIRIENYNALPDIFEKKSIVESDLNYLILQYIKNPDSFSNAYDPAFCFYYYGLINIKNGNIKKGKKYLKAGKKIVTDKTIEMQINNLLGEE